MSPISSKLSFALILASASIMLSACSGSAPSKQGSVWDQRRDSNANNMAAAPAAAEYKQALADVDQSTSDVELSYQAEQVDSFAADSEMQGEPQDTSMPAVDVEAETSNSDGSSVEQEILAMSASSYTVQLFASVDMDRVYKFAEQNQIPVQYIVPTVRDEVIWYVLLLDVYPDYTTAKASMEEIAPSLTTQPWVRSVGSVQKLIQ